MFFQATPAFLPLRRVFQVNLKPLTLSLLLFDVMISFWIVVVCCTGLTLRATLLVRWVLGLYVNVCTNIYVICNNFADHCPKLSIRQRFSLLGLLVVSLCRGMLQQILEFFVYCVYNELVFNVLGNYYRHRCTPPRFLAGDFPNVVGNLISVFQHHVFVLFSQAVDRLHECIHLKSQSVWVTSAFQTCEDYSTGKYQQVLVSIWFPSRFVIYIFFILEFEHFFICFVMPPEYWRWWTGCHHLDTFLLLLDIDECKILMPIIWSVYKRWYPRFLAHSVAFTE